jgi:hypothetical protein
MTRRKKTTYPEIRVASKKEWDDTLPRDLFEAAEERKRHKSESFVFVSARLTVAQQQMRDDERTRMQSHVQRTKNTLSPTCGIYFQVDWNVTCLLK